MGLEALYKFMMLYVKREEGIEEQEKRQNDERSGQEVFINDF